jgi:type IV secretory pathway TrbF-like protein
MIVDPGEDKFAKAKRAFDEVWSPLITARENWQRIAMFESVALIVAVAGMIYLGRLPKQVAYVIERNGQHVSYAGPAKPADMDASTWNLFKVQALKRFVESWRTVTMDSSAQAADWDRAFMYVGEGSQAKTALIAWYEQNDPVKRAGKGDTVTVTFKTFDFEGANTVGLWWDESTFGSGGQVASRKEWRARAVFVTHTPNTAAERAENPLGVLCTELSWQEVNE